MGCSRKMRTWFSTLSSELEASPFHTTHDGARAATLSSTGPKDSQWAWVSFITQKLLSFNRLPAVTKLYTRKSSSFPSTFMS